MSSGKLFLEQNITIKMILLLIPDIIIRIRFNLR